MTKARGYPVEPVRIQVNRADAEEARALLAGLDEGGPTFDSGLDT